MDRDLLLKLFFDLEPKYYNGITDGYTILDKGEYDILLWDRKKLRNSKVSVLKKMYRQINSQILSKGVSNSKRKYPDIKGIE